MGYALGLDLGTTFTAAAVSRDGRADMVSLSNRAAVIPSLVFLRDDEEILVGDSAERRGITEPQRLAREFKRRMGDSTPIMLGSSPYSAERIMALVMREVVAAVAKLEGSAPDRVAITHPANWGPYKTDLLRQAAKLAGLSDAVLLTEPVAAAVHYASTERVEPGDIVAVYDLGGGTFDAAVLRKTTDGFEQLGEPEGIERLGGIDFDEAVFRHVRSSLQPAFDELDHDDANVQTAVLRLRNDAVAGKEALSSDTDTTVPVILPGLQSEIRLTRSEFEAMIRPTLRETVDALRRALVSARVAPDDLKAVLLVGGSSRIPLVAELVSSELGRPVAVDAHPKHAVALGAALVAAGATTSTSTSTAGTGAAAAVAGVAATAATSTPAAAPASTPSPSPAAPPPAAPSAPPARPNVTVPADGGGGAAAPPSAPSSARPSGGSGGRRPPAKTSSKVPLYLAIGACVVAAGVLAFVLFRPSDDDDAIATDTTAGPEGPVCASASGRCAFISDVQLSAEGTYLVDYTVEGYDPVIFDGAAGVGSPEDHHIHFFFDTTAEGNAGANGQPPGLWQVWDRNAEGQLRFDGFTLANQAEFGGEGASQLCAAVGDASHNVEVGSGNCVDLPAATGG